MQRQLHAPPCPFAASTSYAVFHPAPCRHLRQQRAHVHAPRAVGSIDEVRRSLEDEEEHAPAPIPQLSGVSALPARYKVCSQCAWCFIKKAEKTHVMSQVEGLSAELRHRCSLQCHSLSNNSMIEQGSLPPCQAQGYATAGDLTFSIQGACLQADLMRASPAGRAAGPIWRAA